MRIYECHKTAIATSRVIEQISPLSRMIWHTVNVFDSILHCKLGKSSDTNFGQFSVINCSGNSNRENISQSIPIVLIAVVMCTSGQLEWLSTVTINFAPLKGSAKST